MIFLSQTCLTNLKKEKNKYLIVQFVCLDKLINGLDLCIEWILTLKCGNLFFSQWKSMRLTEVLSASVFSIQNSSDYQLLHSEISSVTAPVSAISGRCLLIGQRLHKL